MKNRMLCSVLFSLLAAGNAKAQLAVFDISADISLSNLESTATKIQNDADNIKQTNQKILDAATKDKTADTNKIKPKTEKSTGKAPSPAAATKSFTEWNKKAINSAKGITYGLRAGDQIIDLAAPADSELAKANRIYTGSVNFLETLILIAETVNNDIIAREEDMKLASEQVGKSEDIKGSMDQNTLMQVENTRALNQLISTQNYSLSSSNAEMRDNLTRRAEVSRMLAYRDVNPFK